MSVSKWVTSKKYAGVRYKLLEKSDRSYQIRYKVNGRLKEEVIGKKSEGVTEAYCHQKRNEALNRAKFGDDTPIVKHKAKNYTSVQMLADIYFTDSVDNKSSKQTLGKYNYRIKPLFGEMDVDTIEKDDIAKWKRELAKDLSPKTVNSYVELLSTIFNHSIRKGKKVINPCTGVEKYKINNNRNRYLDGHEVTLLKEACKHDQRLYSFLLLSLSTGGRRETILSVQKKDINLQRRTIELIDFKNDSETYTGFLEQDTLAYLQSLNLESLSPNHYIVGLSLKKMPGKTLSNNLRPILNSLFNEGLDLKDSKNRTVVHTLRHTFASHLAINGSPILTIKKLMNHHDIEQTMRYAKLAPDSGRDDVLNLYNKKESQNR